MASSRATMNKCATCTLNSDEQKGKPGIALCEGCQQSFCLSHFNEHRDTLTNTLDDIAVQRDVLRSRIQELPREMSKEHMETLKNWESTIFQTVTEAASNARQQVHQLIISEMERECTELTRKITSFRKNDNYFETDLHELQFKTEKLDEKLNDLSDLRYIQLNLPTLDCSNMIHIKPFEKHSLPETMKTNVSSMIKSKKEYSSCIERFLTTHEPSTNMTIKTRGYVCASSSMLTYVISSELYRFIFHEGSTSKCSYTGSTVLDIQWSHQFQQFVILSNNHIATVDAVATSSKQVVPDTTAAWQYMTLWKHLCLISDSQCRLFLYDMKGKLSEWFLLYCWSPPTTCVLGENITAVGMNEHYIVLNVVRVVHLGYR
ncbi:unnamed protein product [Adineta steineri]|uniref:B box-type domain-containing protein n=1 Tax=Adineta steineri TaxID=433720 RepID=A0A815SSF9_9BILA|nr:unnamed protein product [Adineta steineri]CAF4081613.1 unnamed protein product [Adineta steineri]